MFPVMMHVHNLKILPALLSQVGVLSLLNFKAFMASELHSFKEVASFQSVTESGDGWCPLPRGETALSEY